MSSDPTLGDVLVKLSKLGAAELRAAKTREERDEARDLLGDALRDAKTVWWVTPEACSCPTGVSRPGDCWHSAADRLLRLCGRDV